MNNITKIFIDRIDKEREKNSRYNKYIFNSHLVMFLLIVFGGILFNYSSWLEKASYIQLKLVLFSVLVVMGYIITIFKVKTFIKEADSVFLLPLENSYKFIFKKLYSSTIITKFIVIILFVSSIYPIIKKLEIDITLLIFFIISIFITTILITIIKYKLVVYSKLESKYLLQIFLIYLFTILWFIFINFYNFAFLLAIIYFLIVGKNISENINWNEAAEYDNARIEKYLKFVNMFVDVPINITKVARRKYLDIFLPKTTTKNFKVENTYNYYYIRAFFRQENTLFLIIRLLIVAILFIYIFSNIYVSLVVIISFNYLSVIQMLPLYKKFNSLLWFYIIPVKEEIKINSFKKLILNVIRVATTILAILSIILNYSFNNLVLVVFASLLGIIIDKYFLNKIS